MYHIIEIKYVSRSTSNTGSSCSESEGIAVARRKIQGRHAGTMNTVHDMVNILFSHRFWPRNPMRLYYFMLRPVLTVWADIKQFKLFIGG